MFELSKNCNKASLETVISSYTPESKNEKALGNLTDNVLGIYCFSRQRRVFLLALLREGFHQFRGTLKVTKNFHRVIRFEFFLLRKLNEFSCIFIVTHFLSFYHFSEISLSGSFTPSSFGPFSRSPTFEHN